MPKISTIYGINQENNKNNDIKQKRRFSLNNDESNQFILPI